MAIDPGYLIFSDNKSGIESKIPNMSKMELEQSKKADDSEQTGKV